MPRSCAFPGAFPGTEEIDLTLSSPEPDSTNSFYTPRSRRSAIKSEASRSRRVPRDHQADGNNPHQGERPLALKPVDQDIIARLIDTTDKQGVKAALLNLSQFSPAFSRALAHALTPYSAFAQEHLRRYPSSDSGTRNGRRHPPVNALRSVPSPTRGTSFGRRRHMEGSRRRSTTPSSDSSDDSFELQDFAPRISPESPTLGSVSDEIESIASLPEFPASGMEAASPTRLATASTSAAKRGSRSECANCGKTFIEPSADDECLYHPGQKSKTDNKYSCCDANDYDAPCQLGPHVGGTIHTLASFKRPLADLSYSRRPRKSPRLR
jgi:hypothetical protein